MRIRKTTRDAAEVPTGSFADIAFLLIVFFILTTTFVLPAGETLSIPAGTSDASKKEDKMLTVSLRPSEIFFGEKGDRVTLDQLREVLGKARLYEKPETDPKRLVVLDSSPDVPYEEYYQTLMVISRAGGVVAMVEPEGRKK